MKKHIFILLTILLTIILLLQRFTGMAIHAIGGLVLMVMGLVHMNKFKKVYRNRKNPYKIIDTIVAVSFFIVMITGFMLKPFNDVLLVLLLHKISSLTFSISLFTHIYYAYKKGHNKKKH